MNELFSDPFHLIILPIAGLVALGVLTIVLVGVTAFVEQVLDWWVAHNLQRTVLAKARLDLDLVPPDSNGLPPLARQLLASGALTDQTLALLASHVLSKRQVPNHLHIVTNDDRQVSLTPGSVGATGGGAFNLLESTAQDKRFVALPEPATMPIMKEAEVSEDAPD